MDSNHRMTGSKPVALPLGDAPTEHPDMTVCLRMGAHYIGCSPRIGHCLALKFNRPLRTRHGVEQRRAVAALGVEVLPHEIGRASCGGRVCQYVLIPGVAVYLQK